MTEIIKFVLAACVAFIAAFLITAMVLFAETAHAVTIKPTVTQTSNMIGWAEVNERGHIIIVSTRLCRENHYSHLALILRIKDDKVIHRGCWIFSPGNNNKIVVAWDDGDVVTYQLDGFKIFEEER